MTKYKIKSSPSLTGELFWTVLIKKDYQLPILTCFNDFDSAQKSVQKMLLRERKESAAFSMLKHVAITGLSTKEAEFIVDLNSTGVSGITPRQYGYLKGIYERQERSW